MSDYRLKAVVREGGAAYRAGIFQNSRSVNCRALGLDSQSHHPSRKQQLSQSLRHKRFSVILGVIKLPHGRQFHQTLYRLVIVLQHLLECGNRDDAEKSLRQAIKLQPENVYAYQTLARVRQPLEPGDIKEVPCLAPSTVVIGEDEGLRVAFDSSADSFGTNPTATFMVELQCVRVL